MGEKTKEWNPTPSVTRTTSRWNDLSPLFYMNYLLLNGEHSRKNCYHSV